MPNDCIDHGCKGYGLGYATAWLTVDGKRFTTTKHRKVFYETTGELPEVVRPYKGYIRQRQPTIWLRCLGGILRRRLFSDLENSEW